MIIFNQNILWKVRNFAVLAWTTYCNDWHCRCHRKLCCWCEETKISYAMMCDTDQLFSARPLEKKTTVTHWNSHKIHSTFERSHFRRCQIFLIEAAKTR
jgi:hypothetical protein